MQFYIILVSLCLTVECWESGQSYLFQYTGLAETGILDSKLGNSIRISGNVLVQVPSPDLLIIQLNDMESYRCTQNFSICQPIEKMEIVPNPTVSIEEPFYMSLQDGKLKGFIELNATNPYAEFQKGIVSLLKGIPNLSPKDSLNTPTYIKAMEEEVTGICENTYEISQIPLEVIASDRKLASAAKELCEINAIYLEIKKIRDFNRCTKTPISNVFVPAGWRCNLTTASCEASYMRSLIQRTLACSNGKEIINIHSYLSEDVHSAAYGTSIQKFYSKISQNLKLIRKDKTKSLAAVPNHRFGSLHLSSFIQERFRCDIHVLDILELLSKSLFNSTDVALGIFNERYNLLRGCLQTLNFENLQELTDTVKQAKTGNEWSLYLDALVSIGTSDFVKLWKNLLETSKISKEDAIHMISVLPMYLQSASSETLTNLLDILDIPLIRKHRELRHTAFIIIAAIYRLACVDIKMKQVRFPFFVEEINCTGPNGVDVTESFVTSLTRYLRHNSSNGDKMAALSAYNIIGHPSIIPIVIPIIEGKLDINPSIRTKGVLTLHKLSHAGNVDAFRILHTVFGNPSENYQVRMAAFTLLMLSNPVEALWQTIALSTWFEPRTHVASFVYTTLETLAHFRSPVKFLQELSNKAQSVVKLAKPPARGLHLSANYIWSSANYGDKVSAYLRLETFANKASLIPRELYGRLNWNLGPLAFDFLEFDAHAHRLEAGLRKLFQNPVYNVPEQNSTLRRIFKLLRIKEHVRTPAEGFLHWTLMESVERFHSFDGTHLESIFEKFIRGPLHHSRRNVEFYNLWPLANVNIMLQNSMGFVTQICVEGRLLSTLHGNYGIQIETGGRKSLHAALNPTNLLRIDSFVKIKSKILSEIQIRTGIAVENFISLPGNFSLEHSAIGSTKSMWTIPDNPDYVPLYVKRICPYLQDDLDDYPVWHCENYLRQGSTENQWSDKFWRELPDSILVAASFYWLPTWHNIGQQELILEPFSGTKQLQVSVDTGRLGQQRWDISFNNNLTNFHFWMELWPDRIEGQATLNYLSSNMASSAGFTVCVLLQMDPAGQARKEFIHLMECNNKNQILAELSYLYSQTDTKYHLNVDFVDQDKGTNILRPYLGYLTKKLQKIRLQDYFQQDRKKNFMLTITDNYQPVGNLYFDLPMNRDLLESNYSLKQEILNILMGGHYTAVCKLETRGNVTTFDGVSYFANLLTGCKYLVLAATGDVPNFALLIHIDEFQRKTVEFVLPEDEIRVSLPDMGVTVNGIKINLQQKKSLALKSRCHGNQAACTNPTLIEQMDDQAVLLDSLQHGIKIITKGDSLRITAKANLRNKVQGLCGDLNEESLFELRGPRRCVLSSGAILSAAYALPDPSFNCNIPKEIKRQLQLEQQHCPRHEGFPTSLKSFLKKSTP